MFFKYIIIITVIINIFHCFFPVIEILKSIFSKFQIPGLQCWPAANITAFTAPAFCQTNRTKKEKEGKRKINFKSLTFYIKCDFLYF
jgi:hypothetical protein